MTADRFVFRLRVPTDGSGTLATYWVTTSGFRTAATDTPASTYIAERVRRAGNFSRSLFSGSAMGGVIRPNYGTLTLENSDGGLDEFAQFAGGGGDVVCYWGEQGASFPAGYTVVYTAVIASVVADVDAVIVRQQDRMEVLARPIVSATFAGTGGLEGAAAASRRKQLVFGEPGLVPLVLIDHTYQVYYVQANATDRETVAGLTEFGQVFEGGVPIDRGSVYPFKEWLFMDGHAPDPGEFRLWSGYDTRLVSQAAAEQYTKGPIYVRLGGVPVGELRFGARGYLQNSSRVPPREWRFSDLCNRAGLNDVEPETMATMQGRTLDFTAGNRFVEGKQTYLQLMSDRCQALLGACGFTRTGAFFCVELLSPDDGDDVSQITFTADNCADIRRQPVPAMERPVWQVSVRAGRAFPCTVFDGASGEMHDILSRQDHLVAFRGWSRGVRRAYPNALATDLEIDGHDFPTAAAQRAFVDRFGALFGTRRDLITVRCLEWTAATLALELHDKVALSVTRLGYSAGVPMRVVSIETDLDARAIRFGLWGNEDGYHSWSLEGGMYPADAGEPGGSWGGEDPPPDVTDQTATALGVNELMGHFIGRLIGSTAVVLTTADASSNAAAMGDFTGAMVGGVPPPGGTSVTWNASDKNASVTLSSGDLTATGAATMQAVRATVGKSAGQWYFEVTVGTAVTFGTVGVATASASLSTWVGGEAASYGLGPNHSYTNGGSDSTSSAVADGDVVGVAVDLDAGLIWWSINGVWINDTGGDGGDPGSGLHERYSGLSGTYYPASSPGAAAHTINATFSYTPPVGFAAWE